MAETTLTRLLEERLEQIRGESRYKREVVITTPQNGRVDTESGPLINLCANNYLGLAAHPAVVEGAHRALDERGAGMASVRFICGTQDVHRDLEQAIADFLGYEDAILYNSCFDANVGVLATLPTADDAIVSDALNHASIIDGIRLSKARRHVYRHSDLGDLEEQLRQAADARVRLVVTDGVFSMEGELARLDRIVALAREHDAFVMVDDSHGVGVVGPGGRGTVARFGLAADVVVQTGTFGKALGGCAGGYAVGPAQLIDVLRQESRPYLFSNALPPAVVGAAEAALALLERQPQLVDHLAGNTEWFRAEIVRAGFDVVPGEHPIVAIMVGDEGRALELAAEIRANGVLVVAFTFPVVPVGRARIRVQISAAHTRDDLERAVEAFALAGSKVGLTA